MPKVIQPRRHDKELTVEEFWKIKDEGRVQKTPNVFHAYRQDEVTERHRYKKPSDQAKSFNPLALILKRDNRVESNDLYVVGTDDENTFVAEYLNSVQNHLHPALKELKSLVLGRKSILYNLEKIYRLLWSRFDLDETWPLLQAVTRDARGQRLELWLTVGLPLFAACASENCASNFDGPFFKKLFDTLCVFLESYYEPISTKLESFFAVLAEQLMKHGNKYVRKFSVQSFSYVLGNLSEEQYGDFLQHLVAKQREGFFDEHLRLADLLLQRLKVVRGCLTPASLAHFLGQIESLDALFAPLPEERPHFLALASEFVGLVLAALDCRQGPHDSQVLFDFLSVLRALVAFAQRRGEATSRLLVMGFADFLAIYRTDKKRFSPYTAAHGSYLKQVWQSLAEYFQSHVHLFSEHAELPHAIAVLCLKAGATFHHTSDLVSYCRDHEEVTRAIIETAYFHEEQLEPALVELILLLSRELVRRFFLAEEDNALVYSLIVLLRRSELGKLIDLSWLQLTTDDLVNKLSRAKFQDDLIVALRLITFLRVPEEGRAILATASKKVCHESMKPYEEYLRALLSKQTHVNLQGAELYNYLNFTKEIIVCAHHQIGWLAHLFNIYEASELLNQHLGIPQLEPTLWDDLIVSRPSALSILSSKGLLSGLQSARLTELLSSRNREVRLSCLQTLSSQLHQTHEVALLELLLAIDANHINLDNQRQVKRLFCNAEQYFQNLTDLQRESSALQTFYGVLMRWCMGFAFTGFKLVEQAVVSFLKCLIDAQVHTDCLALIPAIFMPFIEYYNYRHSRQYEFDISKEAPVSHLVNAFSLSPNPSILTCVKEDLQVADVETVQWIGLERITQAFRSSKHGKERLGPRMVALVNGYFSVEFQRQEKTIEAGVPAPKPFLLPVKQRFLVTILRLCPGHILPPMQCLHFTRDGFFEVDSVRKIKRNNWEAMWQSRKSDQPRKKGEVADIASTTINLQHLSAEQQSMYLHYLWKDILEANRHKRRVILDHIRNYLPSATPLLFTLLFQHLHLSSLSLDQHSLDSLTAKLKLMNRKSLLNGMFILKSVLLHLKQQVNTDHRLKTISVFILAVIQIAYASGHEQQRMDEQGEEQEMDEEDSHPQKNGDAHFQYKQHRKELQKLLQTLFANHDLETENLAEMLQFLLSNTRINLAKSSRTSVPGLLLILKTVSQQKEYGAVLVQVLNGQAITMLSEMVKADQKNQRPLKACYELWLQIMTSLLLQGQNPEKDHAFHQQIAETMSNHSQLALSSVLSYINAGDSRWERKVETRAVQMRRKDQDSVRFLRVVARLMELQRGEIEIGWQTYIWQEVSKLTKLKRNLTAVHCQKLATLIAILARYIRLRGQLKSADAFLQRIVGVLPSIRDPQQRLQILQLLAANPKELGLSPTSVGLVVRMTKLQKTALTITMDFPAFFESCNDYQTATGLKLIDHEYYLFNLLCYTDNPELSVRRAVTSNCKYFFDAAAKRIAEQEDGDETRVGVVLLGLKLYRVFLEMLPKQGVQHSQPVFWNVVECIDLCFGWVSAHASRLTELMPRSNAYLYPALAGVDEQGRSYFKLLSSLSEANKLRGLKLLRTTLESVPSDIRDSFAAWNTDIEADFPNPLAKAIVPVLEYLILKPTEPVGEGGKSNLGATLAKTALEILPSAAGLMKQSSVKRQLKRLISKLKFSQAENKRNVAVIKMVGALIDGVPGERVNDRLQGYLDEHGFEQFHQKITQFSKSAKHYDPTPEEDSQDQDRKANPGKRERIPDFFERLDELQSEEAINRNFLHFDKKMMDLEEEEEQDQEGTRNFPGFLKKHVLLPLRTMLMMESRTKAEEENSKGQVLLSVAVTKVLLRLPLDTFLREFQKVVGRLGRLLKKREIQLRDNARNCLCEIAKAVGSQLLYAIVLQLKFHLKDNFDKHVLNYTLYKVLEYMPLAIGDLDYCLPLILPSVVDEIFGQSSTEKEMVEKHEVKTLKLQAKKSKGLDTLQLVCKSISAPRLGYLIDFLEKYLREHLVTEVNLGKYDHMLGAITAGLAHNPSALQAENAAALLPLLAEPVSKLREQVKLLTWDDGAKHENSLRREWKRRKAGKEQILTVQEQAGRNGSIFKKMSREIGQRRNLEIIASSLIQFHLALLSFFLKRHVFTLASVTATPQLSAHFLTLLGFLGECVDQRDNRLVTRSLKTLHIALAWKTSDLTGDLQATADRFKSIKKQTSRKILLLAQQLTLADEQLLRECFIFLNDLVSEAALNLDTLPGFVAVIRLHTPTTEDQPHLPQTYALLRTLLYKCPQYLYYPLLDELHSFVRMRLPTCRNKEIRDLSCSILSVYLRPRKVLAPSVEAFNLSQQKHGKPALNLEKRLQEELTFYLSNLQCPGQESILSLLEEFVDNREADELETYGELLLLGLATARTNQVQRNSGHPADQLMSKVLRGLNQSKVAGLADKCLLWAAQPRLSSIRLCGLSFLRIITQQSNLKLTPAFVQRILMANGGLMEIAAGVLKGEAEALELAKSEEQSTQKLGNQWDDILGKMESESITYECDPSAIETLLLLSHFFEQSTVVSGSPHLPTIIAESWKLLQSKDTGLAESLINCLCKLNILPALASYSQHNNSCFQDGKNKFSLKRTLSALIFNGHRPEIIEKLLYKLLSQEKRFELGNKHLSTVSWFLVGIALKAHIKPNIYQQVLPTVLTLLNRIVLLREPEPLDFRTAAFSEANFQQKLLELSIKLSSNSLISPQSRSLVDQTSEILKQVMGVAQYFRAVGEYQVRKRTKKGEEKARVAEMAILQPAEFIDQRRGRTRKLQ